MLFKRTRLPQLSINKRTLNLHIGGSFNHHL